MPTISAEIGTVARRDLVEPLLVRGAVAALPNEDVKLASQVAGRVGDAVAEGDAVRAGQVVAEIETPPLEDQQRQAARRARPGQGRARERPPQPGPHRAALRAGNRRGQGGRGRARPARGGRGRPRAGRRPRLATADRQLARTHVTSPISGQVVKRFVGVGEQVDGTAAQPLVEVANVDRVEVAAHVPAEHLGRVRVGQRAVVVSDAYAGPHVRRRGDRDRARGRPAPRTPPSCASG